MTTKEEVYYELGEMWLEEGSLIIKTYPSAKDNNGNELSHMNSDGDIVSIGDDDEECERNEDYRVPLEELVTNHILELYVEYYMNQIESGKVKLEDCDGNIINDEDELRELLTWHSQEYYNSYGSNVSGNGFCTPTMNKVYQLGYFWYLTLDDCEFVD